MSIKKKQKRAPGSPSFKVTFRSSDLLISFHVSRIEVASYNAFREEDLGYFSDGMLQSVAV
jgi:hypothetical protein